MWLRVFRLSCLNKCAVFQSDSPLSDSGSLCVVGHHQQGDAQLVVDAPQQIQDLLGRVVVQISCWFVGHDQRRTGNDRPRDADSLRDVRTGLTVSENFFDVLGVRPVIGRSFLPQERCRPRPRRRHGSRTSLLV